MVTTMKIVIVIMIMVTIDSLKSLRSSQDQRNKNEHSKVQSQDLQEDFMWFSNVSTSTEKCSSSSSHSSWRLQVQYKQKLTLISLSFFLTKSL